MSQKQIHTITGRCGEYSDRCDWPVVAFLDRKKAEKFVDAASAAAREVHRQLDHLWEIDDPEERMAKEETIKLVGNPFDPGMQYGYPYATYHIETVTIRDWNSK